MQSTEEYLDQLLASVSDDEPQNATTTKDKKTHKKSIEELDESELTEEVLQKQLALLLGLETEDDDEFEDEPDAFMSQYAEQMSTEDLGIADFDVPKEVKKEPVAVQQEMKGEKPVAQEEVKAETSPAPAVSETGVLSADEIAALFASMEADAEAEAQETIKEEPAIVQEEAKEEAPSAPAVSDSGVLSPDEIAALFASMEAETEAEAQETIKEEPVVAQEEVKEEIPSAPAVSDSGVLSPDEIAALFASMETENASAEETEIADDTADSVSEAVFNESQEVSGDGLLDDSGSLTREELEELGLGDIADVLVDSEQEILSGSILDELTAKDESAENEVHDNDREKEEQIVELPYFDFGEEVLLDLENVEEMLEATAKLAQEESAAEDVSFQTEESINDLLSQLETESVQESNAARELSEKAAEEAVNKALDPEDENIAELSENEDGDKKKRKRVKKEKVKKEKVKKEKVKKEKPVKEKKEKVSLKDRISAFMFEDESLDDNNDGKEPLGDGDELAYIDLPTAEAPVKKKKEKAPKKEKKAKAAKADSKPKDENAEIAAQLAEEDKKKAKKKEKPKKEKKPKKVVISDNDSGEETKKESKRGIGPKGIVATLLVCASILGLILVGTYFLPLQISLEAARVAFYARDYEEVTLRLNGRDLNDSDRIMYEKASLLYGLEERYHQSEIYLKRGLTKENLNALLQGVIACNEEEVLANQLGIATEWKLEKDCFMTALQDQYGLDEETVEAICALRNPNYTVAVENVLAGRTFDDMSSYGGNASDFITSEGANEEPATDETDGETEDGLNPDELEDLLPEEEEIIEQLQQENEQNSLEEVAPEDNDGNELYSGSVEGGEVNFVE